MRRIFVTVSLFLTFCLKAQGTDSLKVRKVVTHATLASAAAGSIVALNQVWYAPYTTEKFHFFNDSEIYKKYQEKSVEQWTIFMKPIQTKGFWSGGNPFTPSQNLDTNNPLIAVITRATIKPSKLFKFWRYVPISQKPIEMGFPGLIYTKGVGEAPVVQMATFSVWENIDALKNYAYNSVEHREAIKKTHQLDWYKEEMFARFQPYKSTGVWSGINPLKKYL